ncbi:SDR family NAD(P)-dependent oxidoreductase [Micrococcoides hystricis]|uniref:SDR family NAD(P)-dependent oxidoreductase n=1 Tax=Micrococcoides hystricis TaxID=1572761 RepID=A0ABV6PCA9_9MICC
MSKAAEAVVVLGGTGALGGVVVPALAEAGYHVLVHTRRPVAGERYEFPNISIHEGDLDDAAFVQGLVDSAEEHAQRLSGAVFINGAYSKDEGIGEAGFTDKFQSLFEANVYPVTRMLEVLGPYWRKNPGGRVVLTSAAAADKPFRKGGAYSMAKHVVADLGRQLDLEFEPQELQTLVLAPRSIGERIGENTPAELTEEILGFLKS